MPARDTGGDWYLIGQHAARASPGVGGRYLIRALHHCGEPGRRNDVTVKLAAVYERLGDLYTSTGRFTRAHQHYKQVAHCPPRRSNASDACLVI